MKWWGKDAYYVIPKFVLADKTLNYLTLLVYGVLCSFADNDTGECFPSIDTIAQETQLSNPTVIKCLKELIDKKYVTKQVRKRGTKFNNKYILLNSEDREKMFKIPALRKTGKLTAKPVRNKISI